jgi:hypothetical protein
MAAPAAALGFYDGTLGRKTPMAGTLARPLRRFDLEMA